MVRRYSSVWRFFCRGKSAGHLPRTVSVSSSSSHPLRSDATSCPTAHTDAPTAMASRTISSGMRVLSTTICRLRKQVPSLISRKETLLESRAVRTQPHTVTAPFRYASVCANISLISVCFITQQSFLRRRVSSGRSAVPQSFCTGICAIIPQLNGLCQGCH